nr:hypothetical protein ISGA_12885 [Gordonia sp. NB41Y]
MISDADDYFTDHGALWSLATVADASTDAPLTWLHGYDYRTPAGSDASGVPGPTCNCDICRLGPVGRSRWFCLMACV